MASSQSKGHSPSTQNDANSSMQLSPTSSSSSIPLQVSDFVSPNGTMELFTPDRILTLQRTIGNQAVQRLLNGRAGGRTMPVLGGQSSVARETYDTKGVELDRSDIEDVAKGSYWEQKVLKVYNMTTFDTVGSRFKKDVEERDAVLSILLDVGPKKVKDESSQTVTIPARPSATSSQELNYKFVFKPSGDKDDKRPLVDIHFVKAGTGTAPEGAASHSPSANYADKDYIDMSLEEPHPTKKDTLGNLDLSSVPDDERVSVKFAIWQYFQNGVRDTEIDVKIPIADKSVIILYTLRFKQNKKICDVAVERVGDAATMMGGNAAHLDVSRINGFADNSADAATLLAWWNKRYPAAKLTSDATASLDDLKKEMNEKIAAEAGTADWFKKNYDVHVLNAADGTTRLSSVHKFTASELPNVKDYGVAELKLLEASLEPMSNDMLALLKGVRMVRQDKRIDKSGNEIDDRTGLSLYDGSDRTVIIFDAASMNDAALFIGGKGGVEPMSTMTYAHELGHVIGDQKSIEDKFNKYVKAQKIAPVTWYADSSKTTEFFPEAFALFQLDPEWLQAKSPKLFTWLSTLSTTGAPPP
jgi:hypothetical protein